MLVHLHTGGILLILTGLQADLEEERNVNEEGSNFTMEALQHQVSQVSSCMYVGLNDKWNLTLFAGAEILSLPRQQICAVS